MALDALGFWFPGPWGGLAADRRELVQEQDASTPDLLMKYMFTRERVTAQFHPDDEQAHVP